MAFRFDKLTTKAQGLVAEAQAQAASAGNPEIDPLHLLQAMLAESDGLTRPLLDKMGADANQLGQLVSAEVGKLPRSAVVDSHRSARATKNIRCGCCER